MNTIEELSTLQDQVRVWRQEGRRVGLVPTMGNLHAGHQSLVRQCAQKVDRTVVSVFVNPTQFGPDEDFDRYPRTLEADSAKLHDSGAAALFAPHLEDVYPGGAEAGTFVEVPGLSDILCGVARPGHFRGVATVVSRLFNMVQPDLAIFGEKDWQQLLVIKRMTRDLAFPVRVLGADIVRESDGLAMSSRNMYLSEEERGKAPALNRILRQTANALAQGRRDYQSLESDALSMLREAGFLPDYAAIRDAESLDPPAPEHPLEALRVLAAARLGSARLIDNVAVLESR